jgi:hypothetical protein
VGGSVAILVTGLFWCAEAAPPSVADRVPIGEIARDVETLVAPARRLELRLDVSLTASLPRRGDRSGISVELATRPDFWYAIGVASATVPTAVEVVSSDGTVIRTITTQDEAIVWSVRVFKSIGPLVLSGGVVDNHGALGIELRGWSDRLRLELLASAARPLAYRPPSLRAGASLQWRWIYVQAGVQALADRELRAAYLGIGMRWSDPDLLRSLGWLAAR